MIGRRVRSDISTRKEVSGVRSSQHRIGASAATRGYQ